ncbi:MAG: HDOD domain-containing protein [Planctomycetota bacterium]|nr:MAG: HDOD domain-containing protein [Planctomycetota bacterium]
MAMIDNRGVSLDKSMRQSFAPQNLELFMASDIFKRFREGSSEPSGEGEDESGISTAYRRIREAEILAAIDRLPALPLIVQRILGSLGDEKTDARSLDALISQDMVIAGRVLKLVNSPFYIQRNTVTSIQQAVALIGQRSLRSLVVAVSSRDIMSADISAYGFEGNGLWLNSMVTAALARRAAELVGVGRDVCDEAFVAGLLRDVGMLVLGPIMKAKGLVMDGTTSRGIDIIDRERSALGFDHGWVGERVAGKWKLAESLTLAIGRHHRVPSSLDDHQRRLLALLRVAERVAYNARAGVGVNHPFDTAIDAPLLRAAGMTTDGFKTLVAEAPNIIETARGEL